MVYLLLACFFGSDVIHDVCLSDVLNLQLSCLAGKCHKNQQSIKCICLYICTAVNLGSIITFCV